MTPPFERLSGRSAPSFHISRDEDTEATRIVLPPDASALEMIAGLNDRISSAMTDQELSRILPEEGEVTSEALQEALDWSLTQARDGNPRMYVTFTRLIAGIIQGIPSENRASMREQIVGLVPEAIGALQHAEMPSRDRVTRIYELTMAVAGTMTRTTRESPSEAETAALLALFTAVRDAIHQHLEACESNPDLRPNPDYMLPFCEAQIAMLNGDSETALRNLLETRRIIAELPESSTLGIRQQIQISAELAIQALPRDNAGLAADTFRSRVGLELLSYFYQVDGIASAGESGSADVERNSRDFNLISGLAEDFGIAIDEEEQEFGDEERQALVQLLETQYTKNEAFQEVIDHLELGDMESAEDRAEIWGHLIDHAETVYAHIHEHREAEPYQSVLAWSNEHDRLASLTTALGEHEELRNALAELVGLSGEAPADGIARSLIEFGPLLPTLVEALPESIRNDDANDATLDALRNAANGFNEDGMRSNVTEPMESLFEILSGLSVSQPNYSSAYAALYHGLAEMEEIIPDVEFPEALRTRAREELTEAESFSWRRVFDHLTEPESLAMIIGGAIFTEGISGWMLTRAGTAGEWGALVRGGSLTWRGEAAVGMGVALGMSTFGTISHVARSDRPVGETLSEILPGVALGTLLSGVALGGTMLVGRGLRGALMSESRAASRLSLVGLRGGNIIAGGTLMLAANGLTRGIISGRWEMPGAEEAAETYLMMAAFDLAAAGFRRVGSRFWWRRQLGPMRARAVEELAGRIHRADASIDEAAMRNYLGMRVARGRSLADIEAALAEGLVPTVEGSGSGRTLTFRRGGSGTVRPLSPAARAISSSSEFQNMMQQLHRVVVERLLNTPTSDRVYLEVTHNEELLIRVLDSGATRNPENSFAMGPDSVPVEFEAITDPVVRDVLREYGRELRDSGRIELRNRMFESARRQRQATARIGSGSSPRPEMSRTEAARVILDLSPADQTLMNEIFASDAFQNNWQRLMRSVRATLRNRGDEATTWVVARRNGRTVRFNVEDSEPTIETGEVTFRVDRIGRITGMGEGDSIIRALVQRIPQSTLLPSSTGADVGRRESEDGETRAHRTGGSSREPTRPFQVERDGSRSERRPTEEREADPVDDEDVEEISDEAHEAEPETPIEEIAVTTLRAPPIPRESRRMPPALPGPDARTPETPRPSPRPAVPGAIDEGETAGFSIGGILEGAELASAIDQLIVAADAHPETGTLFVEINPRPGEQLFRIVNIAGFRTHADRGYFVLNRLTNRASSGTSSSYVLEGDPLLPATLSDTNLGELLRQQFQR